MAQSTPSTVMTQTVLWSQSSKRRIHLIYIKNQKMSICKRVNIIERNIDLQHRLFVQRLLERRSKPIFGMFLGPQNQLAAPLPVRYSSSSESKASKRGDLDEPLAESDHFPVDWSCSKARQQLYMGCQSKTRRFPCPEQHLFYSYWHWDCQKDPLQVRHKVLRTAMGIACLLIFGTQCCMCVKSFFIGFWRLLPRQFKLTRFVQIWLDGRVDHPIISTWSDCVCNSNSTALSIYDWMVHLTMSFELTRFVQWTISWSTGPSNQIAMVSWTIQSDCLEARGHWIWAALSKYDWMVQWTTARLARGPVDHGSTGSWSSGPRLEWLVVQWTTARLARGPVDHGVVHLNMRLLARCRPDHTALASLVTVFC